MNQGKMSEAGLSDKQDVGKKKILQSSNPINPDADKWEIKKLGEVCKVIAGQSPEGKFYNSEGNGMPFYQGKKEYGEKYIGEPTTWTTKITKEADAGDILMSVRAPVGPVNFATQKICIGRGLAAIRVGKNIDKEFLFNYLIKHESEIKGNTGAVFNSINKTQIENLEIPLPPLPEQQRIVSILDECFAAIDKAKANAEQNLKNAKELFESYLEKCLNPNSNDFLDDPDSNKSKKSSNQANQRNQGSDKWEVKKLGEVCDIKGRIGYRGYTVQDLVQKGEGAITLSPSNIQDNKFITDKCTYISWFKYDESPEIKVYNGDILFVKTGSTYGKVALVDNLPEKATINPQFVVLKEIKCSNRFLYYALTTRAFKEKVESIVGGAATPTLSQTNLAEQTIPLPPLSTQQTIVRQLDALRAETQKLEAVYQKKIDDLEELKKSILQKAFAGELTTSISASAPLAKIIPLERVDGISTTDLQVGITAIALQKHIEQNQQHSFHHVKAEKIVHLSEYILNIDLERNPVKDAAGPNDFTHAKKVESRARKAGFYSVFKNGDYYDYQQGKNIDSVIQKVQNSLGEKAITLSLIIDMLIPMTTQQAEIIATVFGAWNNLILSGNKITDEDIVTEARENWHKEKLKIPRDKFFKALEWMKQREILIPKGNGKIVKVK